MEILSLFFVKVTFLLKSTKEITKELISRKFFFSERKFLVLPHCGASKFMNIDFTCYYITKAYETHRVETVKIYSQNMWNF